VGQGGVGAPRRSCIVPMQCARALCRGRRRVPRPGPRHAPGTRRCWCPPCWGWRRPPPGAGRRRRRAGRALCARGRARPACARPRRARSGERAPWWACAGAAAWREPRTDPAARCGGLGGLAGPRSGGAPGAAWQPRRLARRSWVQSSLANQPSRLRACLLPGELGSGRAGREIGTSKTGGRGSGTRNERVAYKLGWTAGGCRVQPPARKPPRHLPAQAALAPTAHPGCTPPHRHHPLSHTERSATQSTPADSGPTGLDRPKPEQRTPTQAPPTAGGITRDAAPQRRTQRSACQLQPEVAPLPCCQQLRGPPGVTREHVGSPPSPVASRQARPPAVVAPPHPRPTHSRLNTQRPVKSPHHNACTCCKQVGTLLRARVTGSRPGRDGQLQVSCTRRLSPFRE